MKDLIKKMYNTLNENEFSIFFEKMRRKAQKGLLENTESELEEILKDVQSPKTPVEKKMEHRICKDIVEIDDMLRKYDTKENI